MMKRAWLVVLAVGCGSGSATTGHIEFMQSQLLKSCALYVSCVTDQIPISGAACADVLEHTVAGDPYDISAFGNGPHPEDQARRVAECAQAATDCSSVMACATQNHDPTYCAAHHGMSCDGELAIHCTNGAAGSFAGSSFGWADPGPDDCTKRGTHCHNGFCSDGLTCSTLIDKICVDATHESLCDEGNGIAFVRGVRRQHAGRLRNLEHGAHRLRRARRPLRDRYQAGSDPGLHSRRNRMRLDLPRSLQRQRDRDLHQRQVPIVRLHEHRPGDLQHDHRPGPLHALMRQ